MIERTKYITTWSAGKKTKLLDFLKLLMQKIEDTPEPHYVDFKSGSIMDIRRPKIPAVSATAWVMSIVRTISLEAFG